MKARRTTHPIVLAGLLSCFGAVDVLHANSGDVDPTFDPGSGVFGTVDCVVVQPDGKVIIGGSFSMVHGALRNSIARLNTDGTADLTFDPGSGADGAVLAIILQPDGRILVGGTFTSINGTERNQVARLDADGSLDTSFNPLVPSYEAVRAIALQDDGKVLVGGDGSWAVVRLKDDGGFDNAFQPGSLDPDGWSRVSSIGVQSDGRIVVGGRFNSFDDTNWDHLVRLNVNGGLDDTFRPGSGPNASINALSIRTNDTILVAGDFTSINGTNRNHIARLNADGSLDAAFNPGSGANSSVQALASQPDGKILLGGSFSTFNGTDRQSVARLKANGSLDLLFDPGPGAATNAYCLALQSDDKVLVGGTWSLLQGPTDRTPLARLNPNGTLDETFARDTGPNWTVAGVVVQPDGKIVLSGSFTSIDGASRNGIARLNSEGTLDTAFDPGSGAGGVNPIYRPYLVSSLALQADGKVLVGGWFTNMDGASRNYLARLNADGSLDANFRPGSGPDGPVFDVALDNNGRILLVGAFTTVNGTGRVGIARLNRSGSLDSTFNPGSGVTLGFAHCVAVQSDGKVLLGGYFDFINGTNRQDIARLNADGSLDDTFNSGSGTGTGSVSALAIQPDGKVLLGGDFVEVQGLNRNHVARLNANGTLDTAFNPADLARSYGQVFSLAVQPDGKVLLAGSLLTLQTNLHYSVARLNIDGSLDTTFELGCASHGNYSWAESIALQPDGRILVGGDFQLYNDVPRRYVARLLGDSILQIRNAGSHAILSWPNGPYTLQSAPFVAGTYTNVPGATSPYTNPFSGGQKYFRLGTD